MNGPVGLYARVSTCDQDATSQIARLREWAVREGYSVGLERVDTATGKNVRRPGLESILQEARGHHIRLLAVTKVDRVARSVQHLAGIASELHSLGVGFYAVDQGIRISPDQSDPTSNLILNVLGAVAEWEGSIISERTKASLAHLKSKGVRLGRPRKKGIPALTSEPPPAPEGGSETTVSEVG